MSSFHHLSIPLLQVRSDLRLPRRSAAGSSFLLFASLFAAFSLQELLELQAWLSKFTLDSKALNAAQLRRHVHGFLWAPGDAEALKSLDVKDAVHALKESILQLASLQTVHVMARSWSKKGPESEILPYLDCKNEMGQGLNCTYKYPACQHDSSTRTQAWICKTAQNVRERQCLMSTVSCRVARFSGTRRFLLVLRMPPPRQSSSIPVPLQAGSATAARRGPAPPAWAS